MRRQGAQPQGLDGLSEASETTASVNDLRGQGPSRPSLE